MKRQIYTIFRHVTKKAEKTSPLVFSTRISMNWTRIFHEFQLMKIRDKFLIICVLQSIRQPMQRQFVVEGDLNQAVMLGVVNLCREVYGHRIGDIN